MDSRTDTADEDEAACTSRHYSESCVSEYLTALTEDAEGPGELEIDFRLTKFLGLLLYQLTYGESSTVSDAVSEIEEVVSSECKIDSLDVEFIAFK